MVTVEDTKLDDSKEAVSEFDKAFKKLLKLSGQKKQTIKERGKIYGKTHRIFKIFPTFYLTNK